ncbi:ROK family transcriptional regulator [Psychromicrobium xiongbiense]|uniref:ROK family transcriptional regulator n=1 Tax=Psychromicrobium xiongbiense TaxID=3051184 RepID=UPI002553E3E7|nr:ROK family transcriptional regulator [Psychromicrobium sp. YIM S02556]
MSYRPSYAKRTRRVGPKDPAHSELPSAILSLIASGSAVSRADLARSLNLAPSTITLRISELIEAGLVTESGSGEATGGRRPTLLSLVPEAGHILAADLGITQAWVGRLSMSGTLMESVQISPDLVQGPHDVLPKLAMAMRELSDPQGTPLRGVGLSLPGPVDVGLGVVDSPAYMFGWHQFPVRDWMAEEFGVIASVENDANMMAVGEYALRQQDRPDTKNREDTLFVKADDTFGCGFILNGQLYRGATGTAGDIGHVQSPSAGNLLCACGKRGCLETVVGGRAIVAQLRESGVEVDTVEDVVNLALSGDARTLARLQAVGKILGESLSTVVNFINPSLVVIGGSLSQVDAFVAAIRAQVYVGCHPLATKNLLIEASQAGSLAGLLGAGQQSLRAVLASG